MKHTFNSRSRFVKQHQTAQRARHNRRPQKLQMRPAVAFRQRGVAGGCTEAFNAPEVWHEPTGRSKVRFVVQPPGDGYMHAVTVEDELDPGIHGAALAIALFFVPFIYVRYRKNRSLTKKP
jgi:hypothetical protein